MTNFSETQLFDEKVKVYASEWVEEFREPEWVAFELILHDCKSSLSQQIVESRLSKVGQEWSEQTQWHRRVYSMWRYFVEHFRGVQPRMHVEAAARKLGVSTNAVKESIRFIEAHGIPQAA